MLGISKMECQRSSVLWVSQKSDSEIYEKLPLSQIEEQWGKTDAGKNLVRIALIYTTYIYIHIFIDLNMFYFP